MNHSLSIRNLLSCVIPAFFFAVFAVLGHSFYKDNSWNLVFGSPEQLQISLWYVLLFFLLFSVCIAVFFRMLDWIRQKKPLTVPKPWPVHSYLALLRQHPTAVTFFTLLLLYLPYMIYSCPAILSTDTTAQLENAYLALDAGTTRLKNHHPLAHTLLLYGSTKLGQLLFQSASAGLFLFSLVQICFLFFAIGWMVKFLLERQVSPRALFVILLFYVISPRIRNYMFLLVKDVWFAGFLLLFLVELFRILTVKPQEPDNRQPHYGMFLFSVLGIFFFRQEGVYLIILTSLVVLLATRRRLFLRLAAGTFCLFFIFTKVLLPLCDVKPSNPREMFSIPFQQTARYLKEAGDDVTAEEREAIDAILDYEHLAELYNPNLSDPVKATYDTDTGTEELFTYFHAWFQMLLRHPDIYIQATMNNIYGYFYPAGFTTRIYSYADSAEHMAELNEELAEFHLDLHYPAAFDGLRQNLETCREATFQLPILSILNYTGSYIWLLILWFFYCIRRRNKNGLLLLTPLVIILLVCIAGPTYGWYFRYAYSIAFALPAVILISWSECKR